MAIENVGDQMNMGNQPRVKAEKFDAFMKEREVSGFHKEEYDDQFRTVIYFSGLQTAGQQQFVQVLLNDSIYGMIKVLVGHKAVNEENRGRVLEYLNQLNQRFGAFKYIVTPDGNLELDCSLIANDETFDPEVIMVMLLNVIQPHLESELLRLPAVVGGPVGVHVCVPKLCCQAKASQTRHRLLFHGLIRLWLRNSGLCPSNSLATTANFISWNDTIASDGLLTPFPCRIILCTQI